MKFSDLVARPSRGQLRIFGLMCAVAMPAIDWMWGGGVNVVAVLAVVGVALSALGLVVPQALLPIYVVLLIAAAPVRIVLGELAMLLLYFGLFAPLGLVFRLARRDALERNFDRDAETYWRPKRKPEGPGSYYRQW
jgi:hypothetical protein